MFKTCNEVERWLDPLDYQSFWEEISPFRLTLQPRDHCDDQITCGLVSDEVVLDVLKTMARIELQAIFNLSWKSAVPDYALH